MSQNAFEWAKVDTSIIALWNWIFCSYFALQTKTHILVWQKRGGIDKGGALFTYAAMIAGIGYAGYLAYKMAFPAPPSSD